MNKRFKGSGELSDDNSSSENLLSKLTSKELKSIKVTVPRHDVLEPTSSTAMQRTLEDPNSLVIHRREGEGQHPIFDRKGIVVNDKKHLEERIVKKSPLSSSTEDDPSDRSRSNSYSERSVDSYRSGSSKNRRDYSQSPSRKDSKRKLGYSKDYHKSSKVSPYKGKQKSDGQRDEYREKRHLEKTSVVKKFNNSISPSYRKNESERGRYEGRNRPLSKERYYKDKSPKAGTSRGSRERSPKDSRDRENEGYRKDKYKSSPRRVDYRDGSPKRYDRNRSRSHSPRKLGYKPSDKEKYSRTRSPPSAHRKRHSTSPQSKRRSRSPYVRKHSSSPHSRKHSRSPHFKRSPPREDRGYSGPASSGSKTRRRSGSPYERERERERDHPSSGTHHSGHGRPSYFKRRSRSPYRKYSRSPHRTESRYRRHSRSPYRRDSDGYRPRSRSPSKKIHKRSGSKERSYRKSPSGVKAEYDVIPPEFNYYGAEGFWIPGPLHRPGYIPRGVIPPPVAIPRGMIRPGPSYLFPRPYMPLPPHPMQFRPRFPAQYNRPPRPRITTPATVTITDVTNTRPATTVTATESTSTAISDPGTSSVTTANSVVEEPPVKSEDAESAAKDKS